MMTKVGVKLNLKEHFAGVVGKQVKIVGPTDIEVHKSADGKYFIWFGRVPFLTPQ